MLFPELKINFFIKNMLFIKFFLKNDWKCKLYFDLFQVFTLWTISYNTWNFSRLNRITLGKVAGLKSPRPPSLLIFANFSCENVEKVISLVISVSWAILSGYRLTSRFYSKLTTLTGRLGFVACINCRGHVMRTCVKKWRPQNCPDFSRSTYLGVHYACI